MRKTLYRVDGVYSVAMVDVTQEMELSIEGLA